MLQTMLEPSGKTIRILGMARNLGDMPPSLPGVEVWPSNSHRGYLNRLPRVVEAGEWTRWFNLHSRKHMQGTYLSSFMWHLTQDGSKPFYTQKFWPDLPGCVEFPRQFIQNYFATTKGPNRFFTFSGAWLMAFAIIHNPTIIDLWGFALSDKPDRQHECYKFERPCFFYWVKQAQDRGIEVIYQQEVADLPFAPGDPDIYTGPLYGYSTSPELDWDIVTETWKK